MEELKPYVITIVGPESSGKTSLARELAAFYGCPWVPEFAREYLEGLGRPYEKEDLEAIAAGQLDILNRQLLASRTQSIKFRSLPMLPGSSIIESPLHSGILSFEKEMFGEGERSIVIVDSGMLTLRIWARLKYGISLPLVEDAMAEDVTSMYLLCRPIHAWDPDPLREAPSLLERAWIYNHYYQEIAAIPMK